MKQSPAIHGFLLRGHGLYTWGDDLAQARRHVEILEFLLETTGRMHSFRK
jgi:methylthioribulose-1-phosphate dehydratase